MRHEIVPLFALALVFFTCTITKENTVDPSQKIEIWTEQTPVQRVVEFEKSLNKDYQIVEQNVTPSKSVFPLIDRFKMANPLIVIRQQTGFLPVYAEYFFTKQDSILRYVSYDWERARYGNLFTKQEIWQEESTKLKDYNAEYERIKKQLIEKFGEPVEQDAGPQKTKSASGREDYFSRNTVWANREVYVKLNMIFESMTYRIRLNYYWKN